MYSEINAEMDVLMQGIARFKKINSIIAQLESELSSLQQKKKELEEILKKENLDVSKLENKSIASVFYSIVGSLDKHIEKERREALAAKFKYDHAIRDLEDVEHRLSKLSSERKEYVDYQAKYDQLFEQKKEMLMRDNKKVAQEILLHTEKIGLCKIKLKETREAITAGDKVVESLDSVLRSLDRAANWGTWDILGGGFLSDLEKHSNIDDAKYKIQNTQQLIRDFDTELADVQMSTDLSINIDGFSKFADFFFDGIFSDLNMQNMINRSQNKMSQVKAQVSSCLNRLKNMENSGIETINKLEAEISSIISNV